METSDNTATSSPAPSGTARRSGRVTKAPQKFSPDAPAATKRKRAGDDDDAENESPDEAEVDEEPSAEEDAEDSEVEAPKRASKKKRAPSSQPARARKPATKKPKINGDAPSSSTGSNLTHAARLPSRPKKAVKINIGQRDGDGLYAEIFASGDSSEKVATDWYHKYRADKVAATTDLVNCILASAGCDQKVDDDDIRDPDNCQNRLADLQNVYAEEGITDYPLIQRGKSVRPFRDLLIGFFKHLVTILHETGLLYTDETLMDNITRWVASMSSSTLRPFRHTATTVALAMQAALVDVARKLDDRVTKMTQAVDSEKGRKGKSKERLAQTQQSLNEANKNRDSCQNQITDFFETVFVHRYRDIDPKIRTECVEALGSWIWHLPTVFMEPEYLRYLGWMLSDIVPQTRQEVLKQLGRIFKRDAEKLGHFIDRFRPRLVEMATKDSDVSVRVAAIAVVQILKDTGMLDPEELDAAGRLIFDSELRVRRAVLEFFTSCVNDAIETKVEEMGGQDTVDEIFGDGEEGSYDSPREDWIAIKCLAEILVSYDSQVQDENQIEPPRALDIAVDMVQAVAPETRISLAAQVLYEKIDHVKNWELLAGYLLYDHTASAKSKSKSQSKGGSNEAILRNNVAPSNEEELILLEVLATSVNSALAANAEADKNRRKHRSDFDASEEPSIQLATLIPRLLKKFGAEPSTAVLVLRLEHGLDLDVFQQLRQDSSTYSRLLDEICTQFSRHIDRGVLTEATAALLHARKYDELQELADAKISDLWEIVLNNFRHFDKTCELGVRGNLEKESITEIGHVLLKMSKLSSIADCVELLEQESQIDGSEAPAIEILVRTVIRGKLEQVDETLDDLEDEAVSFAIKTCQFYFMWKVRTLIGAIQSGSEITAREIQRVNSLRRTYQTNLIYTLTSRGTNDDLRLFATGGLCDLHVVFATLRQVAQGDEHAPQGDDAARKRQSNLALLEPLFKEIDPGLINELIEIYDSAERAYARCVKKTLNEPAEDEDPIDEELSDDEDEDELTPAEKKAKELKTERGLCELAGKYVLCILAKMVDRQGPHAGKLRKRMVRNQNKLGQNLKETLAYLDEGRLRERMPRAAAAKKKKDVEGKGKEVAENSNSKAKKVLSEEIIVDEESEPEPEPEEGTEEDLRRRGLLDEIESGEDEDGDDGGGDKMDEDESILGD